MIICDKCGLPAGIDATKKGIFDKEDPYAEEDWCRLCADAYTVLLSAAKAQIQKRVLAKVDKDFAKYLAERHFTDE
jgi:hypothetical protein